MDLDLFNACQHNINAPRVIALLEAGADINGPVYYNNDTALIVAIRANATDIAILLVERGADVNLSRRHTNQRPLHLAILYNRYDIIPHLLNHHADITLTDNDNYTALHYAVLYSEIEIAIQLLAIGAIVDAKDAQGRTPLYCLIPHSYTIWREKGLLLLANGADINTQDLNGDTILHRTINNIDTVRFLLDNGASVEIKNEKGQTPIDKAVILNTLHDDTTQYEVVITLLQEHIASQNVKNAGRRK